MSHQQVRGQGYQQGPQDADVTQWEGGGTQAGLNLEMASVLGHPCQFNFPLVAKPFESSVIYPCCLAEY